MSCWAKLRQAIIVFGNVLFGFTAVMSSTILGGPGGTKLSHQVSSENVVRTKWNKSMRRAWFRKSVRNSVRGLDKRTMLCKEIPQMLCKEIPQMFCKEIPP